MEARSEQWHSERCHTVSSMASGQLAGIRSVQGDVSWTSQRGLGSAEGRGRGLTVQQVVLPPHGRAVTQGFHVLQEHTRIHSCRGHMHLRGASQSMEAIFPDGHLEILCKVNWNGEWHINYLFEDHVMPLLPKGTVPM